MWGIHCFMIYQIVDQFLPVSFSWLFYILPNQTHGFMQKQCLAYDLLVKYFVLGA